MLLVWSGGCDSTLLLYDLAKDSTANEPVRTISIVHPQVCAVKEQRAARKKVLRWMKKKGLHIYHQEVEVKHSDERILCLGGGAGAYEGKGISQYTIWMSLAMVYLKAKEDLYMGYISGDDIWYYRGEIYQSFKHLIHLMGKNGSIKFPLSRYKKKDVINGLKKAGMYDLTWHCETPDKKGERCGLCDPCVRHDVSLHEIDLVKARQEKQSARSKKKRKAARKK